MRSAWWVARRELRSAFSSVPTYAAAAIFLCLAALFFNSAVDQTREASLRSFIEPLDFLVLVLVPMLAARSLADERRTGSAEILFTLPIASWSIVVGKFAAVLVLGLAALATTLVFPLALEQLGTPDRGPMVSQYLGAVLLIGAMAAVGVATSSLSSSTALAGIAALAIALALWFAGSLAGSDTGFGAGIAGLSIQGRLGSFNRGVIDIADVAYFVSVIGVALPCASQLVAADRLRR